MTHRGAFELVTLNAPLFNVINSCILKCHQPMRAYVSTISFGIKCQECVPIVLVA